jgi:hypothetical protein
MGLVDKLASSYLLAILQLEEYIQMGLVSGQISFYLLASYPNRLKNIFKIGLVDKLAFSY